MPRIPKELQLAEDIAIPTGDLRRAGTQYKREHDQKSKWVLGSRLQHAYAFAVMGTATEQMITEAMRRPRKPYHSDNGWYWHENRDRVTWGKGCLKHSVAGKDDIGSDDTLAGSGDFDPRDPNTVSSDPVLSPFDPTEATCHGLNVLASATDIAVQKHEIKQDRKERQEIQKTWEFVPNGDTDFGVIDRQLLDDDFMMVEAK